MALYLGCQIHFWLQFHLKHIRIFCQSLVHIFQVCIFNSHLVYFSSFARLDKGCNQLVSWTLEYDQGLVDLVFFFFLYCLIFTSTFTTLAVGFVSYVHIILPYMCNLRINSNIAVAVRYMWKEREGIAVVNINSISKKKHSKGVYCTSVLKLSKICAIRS